MVIGLKGKKKSINEGLRTINQGFRNEKELEDSLKSEIAKELEVNKPKNPKK